MTINRSNYQQGKIKGSANVTSVISYSRTSKSSSFRKTMLIALSTFISVLWLLNFFSKSYSQHNSDSTNVNINMLSRTNYISENDLFILKQHYFDKLKHFDLQVITKEKLAEIFDDPINNELQYFVIDTNLNVQQLHNLIAPINHALTTRPWITIKKFVYKLNKEHVNLIHHIVFEKYNGILEKDLRHIAEGSYPTNQVECAKRPLFIGYLSSNNWGSEMSVTSKWTKMCPGCINYWFYNSQHINKANSLRHAVFSSKECNTDKLLNKLECINLPSTNCPIPQSFIHGDDTYSRLGARIYFTKAASDGVVVDNNDVYKINAMKKLPLFFVSSNMEEYSYKQYSLKESYAYLNIGENPIITHDTSTMQSNRADLHMISDMKSYFGLIRRPNTQLYLKIQHYVDTFRVMASLATHTSPTALLLSAGQHSDPYNSNSAAVFHSNQSCVFAHIQRNNRTLPVARRTADKKSSTAANDIIEWCTSHTRRSKNTGNYEPYGTHSTAAGSSVTEQVLTRKTWMDLGCHLVQPYSAHELEHIINASLIVAPTNKHIFIATDDPHWMQSAVTQYMTGTRGLDNIIKTRGLQLHILPIRAHINHHDSVDSTAQFFAAVEIAQQCDAYVGAVGSAEGCSDSSSLDKVLFSAMCFRNTKINTIASATGGGGGGGYLKCPNVYSFCKSSF